MKKFLKKEMGISLIALTITVIIILIVTSILMFNAKDSTQIKKLQNMYNDISNLREKVSTYYSKYGAIPASIQYTNIDNIKNAGLIGANDDEDKFFVLDLKTLDSLTLSFGEDYEYVRNDNYTDINELDDLYIINGTSHNIFYVAGIEVKNGSSTETYYTDLEKDDIDKARVEIKEIPKVEEISNSESYVGYYADIDGKDGVDGIIYADLAVGNTGDGQWTDGNGKYSIPKVESGLKNYYVSQEGYEGAFGTKDVLSPTGSGEDRFYVMALEDLDKNEHYWYYNASGNMSDYATTTSKDFGTGKANTNTMLTKYENKNYGEPYTSGSYTDLWGMESLKTEVAKGWFVPSRAEWSAFGEELGITKGNYINKGLSPWYWSSSQNHAYGAYLADFDFGYMYYDTVDYGHDVRLSVIF